MTNQNTAQATLNAWQAQLDQVRQRRLARGGGKAGPLRCVGTALDVGRQVGTSEARIVGPDGKLYAHATTTCAIFESPSAAP